MDGIVKAIQRQGMLPVIRVQNPEQAIGVIQAVAEENIRIIEFPWNQEDILSILGEVQRKCSNIRYGCSRIGRIEQAEYAVSVGAEFFIVSILNEKVIHYIKKLGLPILPAASTIGEIELAVSQGFDRICIEPISLLGGEELFYQLKRTYPEIRFMPRGGITTETVENYLSFSNVFACAGSWLSPDELIESCAWDNIRKRTADAIYTMLGFQLLSIDFYLDQNSEYESGRFGEMFRLTDRIVFLDESLPGNAQVRFTVSTNHIKRSVAYLESKGYKFLVEEASDNANGSYSHVYYSGTINGVLVRLLQKNSRADG